MKVSVAFVPTRNAFLAKNTFLSPAVERGIINQANLFIHMPTSILTNKIITLNVNIGGVNCWHRKQHRKFGSSSLSVFNDSD